MKKNATKNTSDIVVCLSPLLHVNAYVEDLFQNTDKECGP